MSERIYKGSERLFKATKFNNLKEMIVNTKEKYGDKTAFKFKSETDGTISTMTYDDYIEEVNSLGTALISIGLKDKRIGVISENRYEWEEAYLSIVCGTGVVVPLDKSLPENEIINLIERSEIEAIFYSSKYSEIMKRIKEEKVGNLQYFISMDLEEKTDGFYSQKELVRIGKDLLNNGARSFLDSTIDNNSMSIMLFTSGTTDKSKAVQLSHNNICTNIYDIASVFDIDENDTFLSFLPLHHVFECSVGFLYPVSIGASIGFCKGIRHIAENIKDYEVSILISVPLLIENMYKKIMEQIEKKGKLKTVKFGIGLSNILRVVGIDIRRKLFKEIHDSLGGKLRICVAGAAAFDPVAEKGFNDLGFRTYQGYGITETSPVISAEHKEVFKLGSVGKLFPSVEAKIVNPNEMGIGEIAVRGESIMLGYYNREDSGLGEDGWFLTGDMGYFDLDEYLFITGRKKSVIVLKNGKNVYPEEIETLINKLPGVKESFVFGKPEKDDPIDLKLCAEIVYDKEKFNSENIDEIKEIIWKNIKENVNKSMPTYKYIKEIIITEEELIKTTTLKVKRHEEIKKVLK